MAKKDPAQLAFSEKTNLFSNERKRDKAAANRQIVSLQQGDQQVQNLNEQTMYLKYMAERLQGIETLLRELVDQGDQAAAQRAAQPPPPPAQSVE